LRPSALLNLYTRPSLAIDYFAAGAASDAAEEAASVAAGASAAGAEEAASVAAGAGAGAAACSLGAQAARVMEAIRAARAIVVFMLGTHCVNVIEA